jgi:hypothetical protein
MEPAGFEAGLPVFGENYLLGLIDELPVGLTSKKA